MNKNIGIIGAGDIGITLAELLAVHSYNVKVFNRYHEVDGKPSAQWLGKEGKFMDVTDGLELPGFGEVELTHNLDDLKNNFAVVITAGAKRSSPTETREELAKKNAAIIKGFAQFVVDSSESIILIISNPVDSLTEILIKEVARISSKDTKEVAKRIFGVSLVDSMRLRNIVRTELKILDKLRADTTITGIAVGEHGPSMVPLLSSVKIDGQKLDKFFDERTIEEIKQHTILRGNDIIKLTGASSVSGPAYAAMHMIRSIVEEEHSELPCSSFDGEVAIGQIVKFNKQKFSHIVNITMLDTEKEEYKKSRIALLKQFNAINSN
jgi:malate/lactate dehydrogenase